MQKRHTWRRRLGGGPGGPPVRKLRVNALRWFLWCPQGLLGVCCRMKGSGAGRCLCPPNGEREKPPSDCSRRIAVLRPRALGGCGGGRKGGACLRPSPAALKARKEHCGFAAVAAGPAGLCRQGNPTSSSCRLRRPGRTPGSTACSLARGEAVRSSVSASEAFAPFSAARRSGQGAGWGGRPVAVDAGARGQADVERRSGCVPVPVRQGDYRAAHGAARSAHP